MARKFRKRFNVRLVKVRLTYSITEICELFGVHPNTVWSWINKEGLKRLDNAYPYLIHGQDLAEFLTARQFKAKNKLALHQFHCFKCQIARGASEGAANIYYQNPKLANLKAICEVCGTVINKSVSVKNLPDIEKTFQIQQVHNLALIQGQEAASICETRREE